MEAVDARGSTLDERGRTFPELRGELGRRTLVLPEPSFPLAGARELPSRVVLPARRRVAKLRGMRYISYFLKEDEMRRSTLSIVMILLCGIVLSIDNARAAAPVRCNCKLSCDDGTPGGRRIIYYFASSAAICYDDFQASPLIGCGGMPPPAAWSYEPQGFPGTQCSDL